MTRQKLLVLFASHAMDFKLSGLGEDFVVGLLHGLHGLLGQRDADWTQ